MAKKKNKPEFVPRPAESPKVLRERARKKMLSIENLANNIRSLRLKITKDLAGEDEKDRLTALAISVMDRTAERVGNDESASNGHVGVTGFEKDHLSFDGDTVKLSYVGKSGVSHEKSFTNDKIADGLKQAIKNSPGKLVFCTSDGFEIKADRVNRYLDEFGITAKDLRGYSANKWIVEKLQKIETIEPNQIKRQRQFNAIARVVAEKVGHSFATLKKHYLLPGLEAQFVEKEKIIDLKSFMNTKNKEGILEKGGVVKSATVKKQIVKKPVQKFEKGGVVESETSIESFFKRGGVVATGKSGTAYGYTLKQAEEIGKKNKLFVTPDQWWKSQNGKEYTDFIGRKKTIGDKDKNRTMEAFAIRSINLLDLGSKLIKTETKEWLKKNYADELKNKNVSFDKPEEKIPGGLASGKSLRDIEIKHGLKKGTLNLWLYQGTKMELEHTSDKAVAREIALDHLFEDPQYYKKLKAMESKEKKPKGRPRKKAEGDKKQFATGGSIPSKKFSIEIDGAEIVFDSGILSPEPGEFRHIILYNEGETVYQGEIAESDGLRLESSGAVEIGMAKGGKVNTDLDEDYDSYCESIRKFASGGLVPANVGEPYDSMTKYQLEKEQKKIQSEIDALRRKYGGFETDEIQQLEKEIDKIITLLYGENFSGKGQKFFFAEGGAITTDPKILAIQDKLPKVLGESGILIFEFVFKTEDGFVFNMVSKSDYPVNRATPKLERIGIKVERTGEKGRRLITIPSGLFNQMTAKFAKGGVIITNQPWDEEKYPSIYDYQEKIISQHFGKENKYTGSADWGGLPVWTVKGGLYEGTFIVIDDNDDVVLLTRKFNHDTDEYEDETILQTNTSSPMDYDPSELFALIAEAEKIRGKFAEGGTIPYSIDKTKHTKTGQDIYVVRMTGGRMSKDEYKDVARKVEKEGGYWSRFVSGFVFNTEPSPEKLKEIFGGEAGAVTETPITTIGSGKLINTLHTGGRAPRKDHIQAEIKAGKMEFARHETFDAMTDSSNYIPWEKLQWKDAKSDPEATKRIMDDLYRARGESHYIYSVSVKDKRKDGEGIYLSFNGWYIRYKDESPEALGLMPKEIKVGQFWEANADNSGEMHKTTGRLVVSVDDTWVGFKYCGLESNGKWECGPEQNETLRDFRRYTNSYHLAKNPFETDQAKPEEMGTFAGLVDRETMAKAWRPNTPIEEVFKKAGKEYPKQVETTKPTISEIASASPNIIIAKPETIAWKKEADPTEIIFSENQWSILNEILPKHQLWVVKGKQPRSIKVDFANSLERQIELYKVLPAYGTQDGKGKEAVSYLHYFSGGSDWYVTEKDTYPYCYGFAILGGDMMNAEFGSMSFDEFIRNGKVELDFHWEPKTINEALGKKSTGFEKRKEVELAENISEKLEGSTVKVTPTHTEVSTSPIILDPKAYKNAFEINKAIEKLVDELEATGTLPGPEEKAFMEYYSGYGGLGKYMDIDEDNPATLKEATRIKYQYFTADFLVKKMWNLAYKHGYRGGPVIEPSCGIGAFFKYLPSGTEAVGVELEPYPAKICRYLYPNVSVRNEPFQNLFIQNNVSVRGKLNKVSLAGHFELNIGNPPYGEIKSGIWTEPGTGKLISLSDEDSYSHARNFIDYFIFRGLDMLKPGGLLIFVVGSTIKPWLETGNSTTKTLIAEKADLIDAYRLPDNMFERTSVTTEIIVLRKK